MFLCIYVEIFFLFRTGNRFVRLQIHRGGKAFEHGVLVRGHLAIVEGSQGLGFCW